MPELMNLIKARDKVVAQREWAIASAKFYADMHLTAQVGIRDIDQEGRGPGDVFQASLAALKKEHKFNASPDQQRMLRNRLTVAFHEAVQDKTIQSTGSGRDRLYRLPKRRQSRAV